jgi:hypothetical protein
MHVDYIGNYIDYVTLNLNNRTSVIGQVDQIPKIESLSSFTGIPIIKLDFLNLPLMSACVNDSNYLIVIKFKQTPPINYILSYDVMLTNDPNYSIDLQKEYFSISYISCQPLRTAKPIQLIINKGVITMT